MENENIDGQETEETSGITLSEPEVDETEETQEETPIESTEAGEVEQVDNEKVVLKDDSQDKINEKINKSYRAKKEAEEVAAAEKVRREELEVKLKELQKVEIPEIPQIPDYLDPDFDLKMAERDKVITQHAQEQSRQHSLAQIEADKAAENAQNYTKKIQGYVDSFDERTVELGLDKKSLMDSQNVVQSYIPGKRELAEFLLSDKDNGPLNVLYLSQNLGELEKVSAMSETNAAVYIATKIAPEAQKLKPKTTNAPDPAYEPKGRASGKGDHPMIAGATFT